MSLEEQISQALPASLWYIDSWNPKGDNARPNYTGQFLPGIQPSLFKEDFWECDYREDSGDSEQNGLSG